MTVDSKQDIIRRIKDNVRDRQRQIERLQALQDNDVAQLAELEKDT